MIEVADIKPGASDLIAELAFSHAETKTPDSAASPVHGGMEIYEITGPFFFGVADMLQGILRNVAKPPRVLILRMRDVPVIDSTGISALESFMAQCRRRKIRLILCEIRAQPKKALDKAGFTGELGTENITAALEDAIKTIREEN
jgi:SulP family sulfate permease